MLPMQSATAEAAFGQSHASTMPRMPAATAAAAAAAEAAAFEQSHASAMLPPHAAPAASGSGFEPPAGPLEQSFVQEAWPPLGPAQRVRELLQRQAA